VTGISRISVNAKASNSLLKCLLRPSQGRLTRDRTVLAAAASRQRADDHTFLVKHIEVPPLHRFNVVVSSSPLFHLKTSRNHLDLRGITRSLISSRTWRR